MGIILGFYLEVAPLFPLLAMLLFFPVLYWLRKKQSREGLPYFEIATAFTAVSLGIFVVAMGMGTSLENHYSQHDFEKESLWHLKVREVLKPNPYSQRYVAQVISLDDQEVVGKVLLNLPVHSTHTKLKVDDEFFVLSSAEAIRPPLNPHQFDYKDYLRKQAIHYQVRATYNTILIADNPSTTLLGLASNAREHIISKLKKEPFGPDELSVIQALLLGQRDDISESTYNDYKNAGAVHILAVSGLHVGILLLLLQFLLLPLERFPKGKTAKLVLVVLLLWTYAFVAGLSPSIVRAVTMFSFLAYAMHLNRPTNSFNIIALSILFILLIKPLFLFQVGFQMSYAAVFTIVWIYPKLQKFWFPENVVVRKTWQLLSVSIAAQLGVLPISLFYFHQFPALFFISNLVIIPFLGLILGMGILIIVLSLANQLPAFLVTAYDWIIGIMNAVVNWVAKQEGFIIKDIPFDSVQLILGYFAIISLVLFLSRPKRKIALVLFAGIITLQGWAIWNQFQLQQKESLILVHRTRNTILLHQTGNVLQVFAQDTTNLGNTIKDYAVSERIQHLSKNLIQNSYLLNQKRLYVMDSMVLYPMSKDLDFLLLTQSPKINLERLLDSIQPKMVLADGSNYRSYAERWKETCAQKEIPFHYTGEKGYYVFDLEKP
ncbi:ComEC/Rec2 family competence protein [Muricauda sp. MAR_2010_75]|uniref:ComEC/Rec2 family competence protein n=1 Tax=Allomuricauda sp. MAR_2010_75 TaxID=1250232 RepID=UPI001E29D292|nr:ComEC/Rec2 family competence protein [Muricauda sp. MAR_2010_75]